MGKVFTDEMYKKVGLRTAEARQASRVDDSLRDLRTQRRLSGITRSERGVVPMQGGMPLRVEERQSLLDHGDIKTLKAMGVTGHRLPRLFEDEENSNDSGRYRVQRSHTESVAREALEAARALEDAVDSGDEESMEDAMDAMRASLTQEVAPPKMGNKGPSKKAAGKTPSFLRKYSPSATAKRAAVLSANQPRGKM
jgi:hypothetical protein